MLRFDSVAPVVLLIALRYYVLRCCYPRNVDCSTLFGCRLRLICYTHITFAVTRLRFGFTFRLILQVRYVYGCYAFCVTLFAVYPVSFARYRPLCVCWFCVVVDYDFTFVVRLLLITLISFTFRCVYWWFVYVPVCCCSRWLRLRCVCCVYVYTRCWFTATPFLFALRYVDSRLLRWFEHVCLRYRLFPVLHFITFVALALRWLQLRLRVFVTVPVDSFVTVTLHVLQLVTPLRCVVCLVPSYAHTHRSTPFFTFTFAAPHSVDCTHRLRTFPVHGCWCYVYHWFSLRLIDWLLPLRSLHLRLRWLRYFVTVYPICGTPRRTLRVAS